MQGLIELQDLGWHLLVVGFLSADHTVKHTSPCNPNLPGAGTERPLKKEPRYLATFSFYVPFVLQSEIQPHKLRISDSATPHSTFYILHQSPICTSDYLTFVRFRRYIGTAFAQVKQKIRCFAAIF
jgi:hypothetical protein